MMQKLRGRAKRQHKKERPTPRELRELMHIYNRLGELAPHITAPSQHMAILETCLCYSLGHLDRKTRDNLFSATNIIIDSEQKGRQMSLVSRQMLDKLKQSEKNIETDLVIKHLTNSFLDTIKENGIDKSTKGEILKSVIARLAMELTHEDIKHVINFLLPGVKEKKEESYNRHMYG